MQIARMFRPGFNMIKRTLQGVLQKAAKQYPVVTLTGPRQSGKTTLVRAAFPASDYVSLEDPDQQAYSREDPHGFLEQFPEQVILDEVQRTPDLFSYIQTLVDEKDTHGRFILSGSQNFLLLDRISQSLAGRCAILHLLPFSLGELEGRASLSLHKVGHEIPRRKSVSRRKAMNTLFTGFYPRIHDKGLDPQDWLRNYYQTYIERDVRQVANVGNIETFGRFIRLCAGRNGQLLNLTSLGNDCGITHTTSNRWLSILETSFIVYLLRPHHRNFSKRMIKSPKIHFLDTGLLCYLLRIKSPQDLRLHAGRGNIFESFVLSEFLKNYLHRGQVPDLYFWRDSTGHEIDLLIDRGEELIPIEIKSGQTVASDFFSGIDFFRDLVQDPKYPAALFYGGDKSYRRNHVCVYSWSSL